MVENGNKKSTDKSHLFYNEEIENDFLVELGTDTLPIGKSLSRIKNASICVCLSGEAVVEVNMTKYKVVENSLLLLLPGHIAFAEYVSVDFEVMRFTLSSAVFDEVLFRFPPEFLTFLNKYVVYADTPENTALERNKFEMLKSALNDKENVCRREILVNLSRVYYLNLYNDIYAFLQNESNKKIRKTEIFERFVKFVMADYKVSREVLYYANKLRISAKYLSMIVQELNGKNAKKWIDDYVVSEIKIRLHASNESIWDIALDLNFADQSFLNKYFKRQTGISPTHYRKMVM